MNRLLGDEAILYKDGKRLIVDGKETNPSSGAAGDAGTH